MAGLIGAALWPFGSWYGIASMCTGTTCTGSLLTWRASKYVHMYAKGMIEGKIGVDLEDKANTAWVDALFTELDADKSGAVTVAEASEAIRGIVKKFVHAVVELIKKDQSVGHLEWKGFDLSEREEEIAKQINQYVFSANGAFSKLVVSAADENEDQMVSREEFGVICDSLFDGLKFGLDNSLNFGKVSLAWGVVMGGATAVLFYKHYSEVSN